MHDPAGLLAAARDELARFPAVLERLLAGLDAAAWRARPAPKEWAPVEIVCHLRDEEVEDFGARVRVIADGGAGFAPIDPERWAVERDYLQADGPATLAELAQFPPGGTNSMQRDLMSGRPSELEALAGAVVRLGQALCVPTPVNTVLYHSLLPLELQARGDLVFPT